MKKILIIVILIFSLKIVDGQEIKTIKDISLQKIFNEILRNNKNSKLELLKLNKNDDFYYLKIGDENNYTEEKDEDGAFYCYSYLYKDLNNNGRDEIYILTRVEDKEYKNFLNILELDKYGNLKYLKKITTKTEKICLAYTIVNKVGLIRVNFPEFSGELFLDVFYKNNKFDSTLFRATHYD